jgi:hypothetical protein
MGKAPKPPDPRRTAESQFELNMGTSGASSIMNNPNIFGPMGSSTYSRAGTERIMGPNGQMIEVPRYNQTTTLSKPLQQQFDQRNSLINTLMGQAQNTFSNPMSTAGATPWQTGYNVGNLQNNFRGNANTLGFAAFNPNSLKTSMGTRAYNPSMGSGDLRMNMGTQAFNPSMGSGDLQKALNLNRFNPTYNGRDLTTSYTPEGGFSEDRRRVEEAMMSRGSELLGQNRDAEIARMAAMGLAPGGAAYSRVSDQFERSANDLAMQAVLGGGQEQSRMLGEARSAAGFTNQAMGQAFEMDASRNQINNAQRQAEGAFRNQAVGQGFGMDMSRQEAENNRRAMEEQFRNAAVGQGFGMDMTRQQAENQRRGSEAQFGNDARQAGAQMQAAMTQMENARRMGDMAAFNAAKEAYNQAQIAQTGMNQQRAGFQNQTRQAQVAEMMGLRGNQLNELLGLISGTQVQSPTAPNFQGQAVGNVDFTGLMNNNYQQQVAAHNSRMQGFTNMFSAAMPFFF